MLFRGPAFYVIHSTNQQFPGSAGNYSTSLLSLHKAQPVPMPGTLHYLINFLFSGVAATRRQKNFRNMAPKFCSLWFTTVANNVKRNLCRVPFPLAPNLAGISNILFLSLSLYTESGDGRFRFDPPQRTGSHPANFVYCSRLSWARQQEMDQGSISHSLHFVVTLYIHFAACAYNACVYYIPLVWLYVENGGGGPHLRQHQCYCGRLG